MDCRSATAEKSGSQEWAETQGGGTYCLVLRRRHQRPSRLENSHLPPVTYASQGISSPHHDHGDPGTTSATTPLGASCQSRLSGGWFQEPVLYPQAMPSQKWWDSVCGVAASSGGHSCVGVPLASWQALPRSRCPCRHAIFARSYPSTLRLFTDVDTRWANNVTRPAWFGPRRWTCSPRGERLWPSCRRSVQVTRALCPRRTTKRGSPFKPRARLLHNEDNR